MTEWLATIWNSVLAFLRSINWFRDTLDIALVAFVIFNIIKLVRDSRAEQLLKGILIFGLAFLSAWLLELQTMYFLLKAVFNQSLIVLVIVFQPEIRRALERVAQVLEGEFAQDAADAQVACLVGVVRIHRHILHHGAHGVQAEQHVGLEEVAVADRIELEVAGNLGMDGGVAVGRIEHLPVPGRSLGHEGQQQVAQPSHRGHAADVGQVPEAVALGVVGVAVGDGRDEVHQQCRVHLPVAIDLDQNVHAIGDRRAVTGLDGAADAAVVRMEQHGDARVVRFGLDQPAAAVGAGVVDAVDRRHLLVDRSQHRQHVAGYPVAGNHHGDAG